MKGNTWFNQKNPHAKIDLVVSMTPSGTTSPTLKRFLRKDAFDLLQILRLDSRMTNMEANRHSGSLFYWQFLFFFF